jgi:hypothetical protein
MAEKNGADIGAVYQAVQSLAGEMRAGFADVRTRLDRVETGLDDVRHTLTEYHSAVIGHGILISDLEARIRRLERHVGLPPES